MNVPFLDIFFLIVLLASLLVSTLKGFAKCVLSKVAFVVSILAAVSFTPAAEQLIEQWVSIKYLTTVLSFLACFIIAFVLLKIIQILIEKIFKGRVLGSLDKILGAVWGILIGFLICVAILLVLMLIPVEAVSEFVSKSYFAKFMLPFLAGLNFQDTEDDVAIIKEFVKNFEAFNV